MKISVITVVYNAAGTIERTIKSVLSQSYKDIEYIIIDGGSTDGTLDVITKYRDRLACIVSEPDNGIYDAMNKGIKKASGDIIGLLNADDWYEPEALKSVADAFESSDADIIYGNIYYVGTDGVKTKSQHKELERLFIGMVFPHPATFVRQSAYDRYGLFDAGYRIAGDWELMLRMYVMGAKFKAMDVITTNFMTTGASFTLLLEVTLECERVFSKYKHLCPYKDEAEQIIRKRVISAKADFILKQQSNKICKILYSLLGRNHFVVWGTGVWGERISDLAAQTGIAIDFFVDSDAKKHGQKFCGIDIKAPSVLNTYEGIVFIAVRNHDTEITDTIAAMNIPQVQCILLKDFINAL